MKKLIIFGLILLTIAFFYFNIKTKNPQGDNTLPQQYVDDRTNYAKAIQLLNDAMDLTKTPDNSGKPFDMPKDQESKILTELDEGIALSKQIDDNFLDYLSPELKSHYRNQYVKGYELILEGLKSDTSNKGSLGVKEQLEGSQLIGEWNKWWNLNKDQITNKAFPE
ncbi:MAG TPA: hypothetical protein VLF89_01120 [Candidatus Saccharimonadales bacterium]|nr:hypothetical protein [Candidatus Saccharimonadales bacterium]